MPKKTKRQKLHADRINHTVPVGKKQESVSDQQQKIGTLTYTLPSLQQRKSASSTPTIVSAEDQTLYAAMAKDITKTVIIALFIFAAQAIIYWKLRV